MLPGVRDRTGERAFCSDLVNRIRPKRQICEQFSPGDGEGRRLALTAFLCALEEATGGGRDAQVAKAKLAWWHNELLVEPPGASEHPVIRLMVRTGMLERVERRLIREAVRLAQDRISRDVIPDLASLRWCCERMGAIELQCELAVGGHRCSQHPMLAQGSRLNGLAQLLRQSLRAPDTGCWWLPLDLSSRFGVAPDVALVDWVRAGADGAIRGLHRVVRLWAPSWQSLDELSKALTEQSAVDMLPPEVWVIDTALQSQQLRRLGGTRRADSCSLLGMRPVEALFAWRVSRRLRSMSGARELTSP